MLSPLYCNLPLISVSKVRNRSLINETTWIMSRLLKTTTLIACDFYPIKVKTALKNLIGLVSNKHVDSLDELITEFSSERSIEEKHYK